MLKIKRLKAKNVHGYIPINIKFNNDLTFLTGSNGCGKTTALKLISAMLLPNFDLLNIIKFDNAELSCWSNTETVIIKVKKDINNLYWKIDIKPRKDSKIESIIKSSGDFQLFPNNSDYRYSRDEYDNLKDKMHSDFISSEFYNIIDNLGNPILLGIDRKISGRNYDNLINRRHRLLRSRHDRNINNLSFLNAQQVLIDYASANADVKKTLVEDLKANIFKTLFKYVDNNEIGQGYSYLSQKESEKKKSLTLSAISQLELGQEIEKEVHDYFKNISNLQIQLKDKKSLNRQKILNEWWANRPHLSRIEIVSKKAEEYQKEIAKLDQPLTTIASIVNKFFLESNKKIKIGANGRITLEWNNKNLTSQNFSSGEIQLVVIIIHLVFCEFDREQSIFVIDEPELSLHLSWQEKFVDAIKAASPGTQFILATHSPAIISKLEFESKCIYMKNI